MTEDERYNLKELVKELNQPTPPPPEPQATNESTEALLSHDNNPVYPE